MPVRSIMRVRAGRTAGVASYRVAAMKSADTKNDSELTMNATSRPKTAVTTPPTDAPMASIADHVALDNALAGSSSWADVMFGMVAVRAGSKKACAETAIAVTTYAIQTWSARRTSRR